METFGTLKRRTTDLISNINVPKPELPKASQVSFPSLSGLSSHLPKLPAWGSAPQNGVPTLKGTWERIRDVPAVPRSSHSVNVVSGKAYIFGGEIEPRKPVDNDVHVIVLPYSSAEADYYTVKPKAAPRTQQIPTVVETAASDNGEAENKKEKDLSDVALNEGLEDPPPEASAPTPAAAAADRTALGDVPCPRVGHATAVIGNRIFLFGGRGGPEMAPLEEHGRVWVFDTKTNLWSYLDPYLPAAEPLAPGYTDKRQFFPAARSYHAAAGVDLPRDFGASGGDFGTPQRPIVGSVANNSRDEDEDGYGTFVVHGGCFAEGRASDTWAFDVRSRVWQELPSAPGKPRGGAALAVAAGKLWRFGGFNGEGEEGGQLDYLELAIDKISGRSGEADAILTAKSQWKSFFPDQPATPAETPAAAEGEADASQPLTASEEPHWPGNRSVAGLQTVTIGGPSGRQYLLLALGERDPSNNGHEAAGKFWSDVWAYELPRPTAAGQVMGMAQGGIDAWFGRERSSSHSDPAEGKWFRVETEAYDDEDETAANGPGSRGWFASAQMGEVDERGVVIWGGVNGENNRLPDGWIVRLGPEKREI